MPYFPDRSLGSNRHLSAAARRRRHLAQRYLATRPTILPGPQLFDATGAIKTGGVIAAGLLLGKFVAPVARAWLGL